jgi:hypothetical protein
MTGRQIPMSTRSLLPPSSGKKGPRLFCLQTTQVVSPNHCGFPPKHTHSHFQHGRTFTFIVVRCQILNTGVCHQLAPNFPLPASHHFSNAPQPSITGSQLWTGHSRQHGTARQRSVMPSANLEGKCKQELEERRIEEVG